MLVVGHFRVIVALDGDDLGTHVPPHPSRILVFVGNGEVALGDFIEGSLEGVLPFEFRERGRKARVGLDRLLARELELDDTIVAFVNFVARQDDGRNASVIDEDIALVKIEIYIASERDGNGIAVPDGELVSAPVLFERKVVRLDEAAKRVRVGKEVNCLPIIVGKGFRGDGVVGRDPIVNGRPAFAFI